MASIVAFCSNAEVFNNNRILNKKIAKKYPGALWVATLAHIANKKGIRVVTGDYALKQIMSKKYNPSDILVIQEDFCILAQKLISLGAHPFLLYCAESSLYADKFYTNLFKLSSVFKNRILFRGVLNEILCDGKNHVLYFPSFNKNNSEDFINNKWSTRSFIVMVAANKYWNTKRPIFSKFLLIIKDIVKNQKISRVNKFKEFQLHDKRLELIEFFGQTSNFSLYGKDWDDLNNLNDEWISRLKSIIDKLKPLACSDKQIIISKYKFALCLENIISPGYVTEKIFDCFKAGVIPIYMGAPDILDFVPESIFIDLRNFSSNEILNDYLENLSEQEALKMISNAHKFIKSDDGMKFSYENFAENVMSMVDTFEK